MCDAIVFQHVGDMQGQHSSVCSGSPASLWWDIGLEPSCSDTSNLLSFSPSPNYSTAFLCLPLQNLQHNFSSCVVKIFGDEKRKPLNAVHFLNVPFSSKCGLSHCLSLEVKCRGENSEPDMWKWHGRCKADGCSKFCCFPYCLDFICVSIVLALEVIYQERNRVGNWDRKKRSQEDSSLQSGCAPTLIQKKEQLI